MYTVGNRKPVKNEDDVVIGASVGEQAGSRVLDILELLRVLDERP